MSLLALQISTETTQTMESNTGLTVVDWLIIITYATSTLFLGWFYGRKQKSTKEYFTGSGKMNPVLIGVSLFASLLSTITYLSQPGEIVGKGPVYLINYLAYPFIFFIVGYVVLPVYMRHRVTSAYELLEERMGLSVRLLGASMFLMLRLVWMSLLILAATKAFCKIAEIGDDWIPYMVVLIGSVSLIYASLGGLRAVVITDLMQTVLLYGGAVLVVVVVTIKMSGFGWFPTEWQDNWDTQPLFSFDVSTRITMLGTILSVLIWYTATSAGDQVSIQRFMATSDAGAARKAIGIQLIISAIVGITLGLAGFAMLGFFQQHPELLPVDFSLKDDADQVFPLFIAFHLPPVVSGLVTAGLLAAAMSSMDSGVNSISAVVTTDFVDRLFKKQMTEQAHIRFARLLAVIVGIIVLFGSMLVDQVPGNIMAVTQKTVNLLTVPIFCLFLFSMFFKRASPVGVWIGWLFGTTVAILIAFSGPIFGYLEGGRDPVSFQWITPAALVVNVVIGLIFSTLFPKNER
jgi:solute:Na+ symporter, SSS family